MKNRLALHINYLLRRNQCVVLPRIGVFSTVYVPASYDTARDLFLPPCYKVTFDTKGEEEDDALLLNSYIRKYGLTAVRARRLLEEDLNNLYENLESHEEVNLEGLGQIRKKDNDSLSFSSGFGLQTGLKELGLRSVTVGLNRSKRAKIAAGFREKGVSEEQKESAIYRSPDKYYFSINKKFANIAASFLLVVVVAFSTLVGNDNFLNPAKTASILPVDPQKVKTEMPESNLQESETAHISENEDSKSLNTRETDYKEREGVFGNAIEEPTVAKYALIVAAFKTNAETDNFIKSLPADEFNIEIIKNNKYYMVSLASSDDSDELTALKNSDNVRKICKDSWIWRNKDVK